MSIEKFMVPILAVSYLSSGVVCAQQGTLSSKEQIEKNAIAARSNTHNLDQDYSYVDFGWDHLSGTQDTIANKQDAMQRRNPNEASSIISIALTKGLNKCDRNTILRCVVALKSPNIYYSKNFYINRKAILKRSSIWMKNYSMTEYRWRTLAHYDAPQRELIPAFDRLLRNAPFHWQTDIAAIYEYTQFNRSSEGLGRLRTLIRRYPDHAGTRIEAARIYARLALVNRDVRMLVEARDSLEVGEKCAKSEADSSYAREVRAIYESVLSKLNR